MLLWGTFAMLWMPWADYQKSYRSVALQLRSKIPVDGGCIAQRGARHARRRAALDYHAGIRPQPFDPLKPRGLPAAARAGQPEGRIRRSRRRLDQARRRRPARRQVASAIASTGWTEMNTTSPTDCPAWAKLAHHAESWRDVHLQDLFEQDVARSVAVRRRGARACATTTRASASAR